MRISKYAVAMSAVVLASPVYAEYRFTGPNINWGWNDLSDASFSCQKNAGGTEIIKVDVYPSKKRLDVNQNGSHYIIYLTRFMGEINGKNEYGHWEVPSPNYNWLTNDKDTNLHWHKSMQMMGSYFPSGWSFVWGNHGAYDCVVSDDVPSEH